MNRNQQSLNSSTTPLVQGRGALKKHGYIVFMSWLFLTVVGIVGISLLPNVYRATTTVLVDPQKIPERYVASTVTSDPNARMNTLTQQVLSASRLQELIEKDDLYPQLRKKMSREEILDYMRKKTTIVLKQSPEAEQGLSSFSISYDDEDRVLVAKVANQLAASFIDWNLRGRQQQALGTTQFLTSELAQAKNRLMEQESQLEVFKMKHAGGTPDQLIGNLQALSGLRADIQSNMDAISRLDQERILLSQVKPIETRDTASLTGRERLLQEKRRLESERSKLRAQFTDRYPDVAAITEQLDYINAQLAATPDQSADPTSSYDSNNAVRFGLIEKELQRHRQQETSLEQQIRSYQEKVESVPALEMQMAELTRNYEVSRQNYQSLLDKTFSAEMSEELERKQQAERFTILDPARTPERPIWPKRLPMMAGAIIAAFLIPASLAIVTNVYKSPVNSQTELRGMLPRKVVIWGSIPRIASQVDERRVRRSVVQTLAIALIACTALLAFLLKVRPTL